MRNYFFVKTKGHFKSFLDKTIHRIKTFASTLFHVFIFATSILNMARKYGFFLIVVGSIDDLL